MPQNCTKMLRNLTFVVQFAYFLASDQKTFLFFRATFEQLFGKSSEQLVESPNSFTLPDSFCSAMKVIPDRVSVHT